MNSRIIRIRIIIAILIPFVLSAAVSTLIITSYVSRQIADQSSQFGQAIADQLANTAIDYLVSNDVLSLNVILDELRNRGNFDFAAIYNPNNQLLAQSGKQLSLEQSFTREINFQDTNLGYVLIELDRTEISSIQDTLVATTIILHGLIAAAVCALLWFYGDFLYLYLTGTGRKGRQPAAIPEHSSETTTECTLLAIKMKPARLIPLGEIQAACSLYGATLAQPAGDEDWLLSFCSVDQTVKSLRCALLIKAIVALQPRVLNFKAGLDMGHIEALPTIRKQASYLASASEQCVLATQRIKQALDRTENAYLQDKIATQQFHSAFTADGQVYEVTSLDPLVEQQAKQLTTTRP